MSVPTWKADRLDDAINEVFPADGSAPERELRAMMDKAGTSPDEQRLVLGQAVAIEGLTAVYSCLNTLTAILGDERVDTKIKALAATNCQEITHRLNDVRGALLRHTTALRDTDR